VQQSRSDRAELLRLLRLRVNRKQFFYRVNLTQPYVASDVRLKRDIVALGRLDNGLTLYRYRYLWSEELFVGVMAQEVAELVPQAVTLRPEGYLAVDYAQLGLRLQTWDEWVSSH
jgi:nucleoid-associated protein YejK